MIRSIEHIIVRVIGFNQAELLFGFLGSSSSCVSFPTSSPLNRLNTDFSLRSLALFCIYSSLWWRLSPLHIFPEFWSFFMQAAVEIPQQKKPSNRRESGIHCEFYMKPFANHAMTVGGGLKTSLVKFRILRQWNCIVFFMSVLELLMSQWTKSMDEKWIVENLFNSENIFNQHSIYQKRRNSMKFHRSLSSFSHKKRVELVSSS